MTSKQRRINVYATSWHLRETTLFWHLPAEDDATLTLTRRCFDVMCMLTSHRRHVPAEYNGLSRPYYINWVYAFAVSLMFCLDAQWTIWPVMYMKMCSTKLGPEVIKLFSCSTQLSTKSTKFILLINVKMPTIVGILTFISKINTTSERLKSRNFFICRYFSFYEQLKLRAQLSWAWKEFYNLAAWSLLSMSVK